MRLSFIFLAACFSQKPHIPNGYRGEASPESVSISGVQGDASGFVRQGLVISGAGFGSDTAARLLTASGTAFDLLVTNAQASELTVALPAAAAALVTSSTTPAAFTLQLTTASGTTVTREVSILRGEPGPAGANGAPGAAGQRGATGAAATSESQSANFSQNVTVTSVSGMGGGNLSVVNSTDDYARITLSQSDRSKYWDIAAHAPGSLNFFSGRDIVTMGTDGNVDLSQGAANRVRLPIRWSVNQYSNNSGSTQALHAVSAACDPDHEILLGGSCLVPLLGGSPTMFGAGMSASNGVFFASSTSAYGTPTAQNAAATQYSCVATMPNGSTVVAYATCLAAF